MINNPSSLHRLVYCILLPALQHTRVCHTQWQLSSINGEVCLHVIFISISLSNVLE